MRIQLGCQPAGRSRTRQGPGSSMFILDRQHRRGRRVRVPRSPRPVLSAADRGVQRTRSPGTVPEACGRVSRIRRMSHTGGRHRGVVAGAARGHASGRARRGHGGRLSDVHRWRVGELVGRTDPRRDQPRDRRGRCHRSGGHEGGRERAPSRPPRRPSRATGSTPRRRIASSRCSSSPTHRAARRRDREARGAERGQAGRRDAVGGDPSDRRQPPVLRRRRQDDGGQGGGGVHGRVHQLRAA